MTFEEFFIKKKIDLERLKNAEPALFEEFRYDYAQMGEKSFDHTKKFWFNRLRKIYHLTPVISPDAQKPAKSQLATQAEPLSSPTIVEKPLYSPRFKPRIASQPKPEDTPEKAAKDSLAASEHPVLDEGFSFTGDLPPRFMLSNEDRIAHQSWDRIYQHKITRIFPAHGG